MNKIKTFIKLSLFSVVTFIPVSSFASEAGAVPINQCGDSIETVRYESDHPECGFFYLQGESARVSAGKPEADGNATVMLDNRSLRFSRYEASASCDTGATMSTMPAPATQICEIE